MPHNPDPKQHGGTDLILLVHKYEEKKKDRIEEANKELKKIKSHVGDFNTHMQ